MSLTAFLFPGQGSQSVGMLQQLHAESTAVADTFAQASDVLGYDLWEVVSTDPNEQLNRTEVTQPAMLTAGVATWRAWQAAGGGMPDYMAGHSLGEYSALVCGGSIAFTDAVGLVADRGRFMQQATPPGSGAMAAILGLDDDSVVKVCSDVGEDAVVTAANFNSPGQVVIAGEKSAVDKAVQLASDAGARRAMVLAVSVPSHCALMKPAAEQMQARLQEVTINTPQVPVVHNADVCSYQQADDIRSALVRQLYLPVRWTESVRLLLDNDVQQYFECGPGKVLAGLNRRIERSAAITALLDSDAINSAIQG